MQLDSIMVRASSPADVRRLRRAGGEVWQEHYQGMPTGGTRWRYALVKIPAAAAIRLQLVTLGTDAQLADTADTVEPAQGKAAHCATGNTTASRARRANGR